jgi:hypothetical protein
MDDKYTIRLRPDVVQEWVKDANDVMDRITEGTPMYNWYKGRRDAWQMLLDYFDTGRK